MRRSRRSVLGAAAVVGVGLSAAACSTGPHTLGAQLQAWASNAGYSANVAQINADLKNLQNGYRERKLLSLRTACEGFSTDASQLYTQLPTPDHQITNELGSALSDFFTASVDCYASTSFQSQKFHQYQHVMATARTVFSRALSQLESFGVH